MKDEKRVDGARWKDEDSWPITTVGDTSQTHARPLISDGGDRVSEIMTVLANERRRYALYYLQDKETAELDEVTEYIVAVESNTGSVSGNGRTNVDVQSCGTGRTNVDAQSSGTGRTNADAQSRGNGRTKVNEHTRRAIRSDLHHVHLPKLEENGVIQYRYREHVVDVQRCSGLLGEFIDSCAAIELPSGMDSDDGT